MRLRQVALLTRDLEPTVAEIRRTFDLGAPFHDPNVEIFGLRNAVLPIGDTFLEVLTPLRDDCSGARYLARRGGDCGYMVIVQTDDPDSARRRIQAAGARIVFEHTLEDISTIHIHPRDTGALLSIDASIPPQSWRWAGPGWEERSRSSVCAGIAGVEVQCEDPAAVAELWSALLARPATALAAGAHAIALDESVIRFGPIRDERGEGVSGVILRSLVSGRSRAAESVELCGTRFRFTPRR